MRSLLLLALGLTLVACGSSAPSDHTVDEHGVMHHPGLESPKTNCTPCHGASLQGDKGPSCTSCHGVKWQ
jgi:cytochrome c5